MVQLTAGLCYKQSLVLAETAHMSSNMSAASKDKRNVKNDSKKLVTRISATVSIKNYESYGVLSNIHKKILNLCFLIIL